MSEFFNKKDLANAKFFVGLDGGQLECVNSHGEIKWCLGFLPGEHYADQYGVYLEPGDKFRLDGQITLIKRTGRVMAQSHPCEAESGANPDFRPAKLTPAEQEMRKMMLDLTARSDALDRRIAAYDNAKEGGESDATQDEPVTDDQPTPDPDEPDNPAESEEITSV